MEDINLRIPVIVIIIIMLIAVIASLGKKSRVAWIEEVKPITKVSTQNKVAAIACNVYEGRDEINRMLEILDKKNIKITFFIGGVWAEKNRDMILKMKEMGHDLQNHGYYHKRPTTLNVDRNIKEIRDTESLIYKITGSKTTLFEPPYGDYDENMLTIVNSINYKTITWSIDTIDWRKDSTKEIILNRINKKLHPGAIILIHPKAVTANSLGEILNSIENQGYEIISVSRLLLEQ